MSESGKNALGQEAFGSKGKEAPVEQSPAVSAADVTSSTAVARGAAEDHVWFEDRWMVASLCDE
jgi:hypothetical protein